MNPLHTAVPGGLLLSGVRRQNSMSLPPELVHSISSIKGPGAGQSFPLQLHLGGPLGSLSTTTVNVQIPGSGSNISVPLHLTAPTVSLPLQVSGAQANVPVQLPGGGSISVPLQFPGQLTGPTLPSMPLLQNTSQSSFNSSIFHVHMGSNQHRAHTSTAMDISEPSYSTVTSQVLTDNNVQVKISNANTMTQVHNPMHMQIPSSTQSSSIQLQLSGGGGSGPVQLRNNLRGVPQVVYIQTPTGLKPVTSNDVINTASSSGNPPQIIVRRPVTNTSGIQFVSGVNSKSNLAPKGQYTNKSSILAPGNSAQPIVIQKPKQSTMVPVSIAANTSGKQAFAYLSTVKKPTITKVSENQSILIPNNQINSNTSNQKLFLTPMNVPKIQNSKYILPVTLPAAMSTKGPIINLQIANGQLQNDSQGNITVMRETANMDSTEMPPLTPLGKPSNTSILKEVPQSPKSDKTFTISIPGSRAEPTGEQEYTLSIPETNATMNDDIYTVSIADEDEGSAREKSFTLSIPEKGKSLLNKTVHDCQEISNVAIPAPAILRRSNSEYVEKKSPNNNLKRRISLCTENMFNKKRNITHECRPESLHERHDDSDNNDDHRVRSLFCDEQLDKDLEAKVSSREHDNQEFKDNKLIRDLGNNNKRKTNYSDICFMKRDSVNLVKKEEPSKVKRESISVDCTSEEDPPGLIWNNGTALLQGSQLHFQTNEFGLIDVIDQSEQAESFLLNPSSKYQTPLKQRISSGGREKKPTSPEDLYCCDGCGCHGMAAEFVNPNFCSLTCQRDFRKVEQKKKEREKNMLLKKRNRIKKLLMQKQRLESGLFKQGQTVEIQDSQKTADPKLLESVVLKKAEEEIDNEKYPWMFGESGFSWMKYLEYCRAKAAPVKCFKDPFPYNRNGFKVGMKLEAIDPAHPAVFCIVTVAETQGYRMRLHFDSYPEIYDFWVNADSIDIFPPGWCEKNGRELKPPQGFPQANFSWALYLKQMRAIAAPRHLFPHMCTTMMRPNGFRTLMKLEADDRKNNLICVATVADMLDNRILINFDSWDDIYDYWVDPTSPYIHPVGWAEENGHSLTPPNFFKDPDSFTWAGYLSEAGAQPVPEWAFKPRPPQGFKVGMKLEVIDQRVPFLIRVATITHVREHQVRVSFDGWPDELSYWLDDDSPDLHPVGWCLKTGHPLEPPITAEELSAEGPCGVGGCRGLGSLLGGVHKTHAAASLCPYRLSAPPAPPDRLSTGTPDKQHALPRTRKASIVKGKPPSKDTASTSTNIASTSTPTSDNPPDTNTSLKSRPPKHKRVEEIGKCVDQISDEESNASSAGVSAPGKGGRPEVVETVEATAAAGDYESRPDRRPPPWSVLCPDVGLVLQQTSLPRDPRYWTQEHVREFVMSAATTLEVAGRFAKHRITGPDFLMLSQDEMVGVIGLKLGPAIKIYSTILQLRKRIIS